MYKYIHMCMCICISCVCVYFRLTPNYACVQMKTERICQMCTQEVQVKG